MGSTLPPGLHRLHLLLLPTVEVCLRFYNKQPMHVNRVLFHSMASLVINSALCILAER